MGGAGEYERVVRGRFARNQSHLTLLKTMALNLGISERQEYQLQDRHKSWVGLNYGGCRFNLKHPK